MKVYYTKVPEGGALHSALFSEGAVADRLDADAEEVESVLGIGAVGQAALVNAKYRSIRPMLCLLVRAS